MTRITQTRTAPSQAVDAARAVTPARPATREGISTAHLVLIARDGSEGARYSLSESIDLGRVEGSILFSEDPYVSPRHARIGVRRGAFFLLDLESTNGVFVRIPFAAFAVGGGPFSGGGAVPAAEEPQWGQAQPSQTAEASRGDPRDTITIRGHHSESLAEPRSAQLLADQELFLVGQQVLRFEVVSQAEEGFGAASQNGTLLFGTPAAPRYARLSQRTVEGVVRDVFHLRKEETVIGRESGDIVFTEDPFLSRRHAVVRMQGGAGQPKRFTLADLGSSNGTFLRIREEVRLQHGDHFRIGQQLLRFDLDAARAVV
jgi:pSer/pThr/pTyr-binding forkhead associated (FHA) protein